MSVHNHWTAPDVVLTLIGWVYVLKALFRFVAPETVLRIYARMGLERAWQIQVAGGFLLVFSACCAFLAFRQSVS